MARNNLNIFMKNILLLKWLALFAVYVLRNIFRRLQKSKWKILHFCNFENIMKSSFIAKFMNIYKYYKLKLKNFSDLPKKRKNSKQSIGGHTAQISNPNFLKINVKLTVYR